MKLKRNAEKPKTEAQMNFEEDIVDILSPFLKEDTARKVVNSVSGIINNDSNIVKNVQDATHIAAPVIKNVTKKMKPATIGGDMYSARELPAEIKDTCIAETAFPKEVETERGGYCPVYFTSAVVVGQETPHDYITEDIKRIKDNTWKGRSYDPNAVAYNDLAVNMFNDGMTLIKGKYANIIYNTIVSFVAYDCGIIAQDMRTDSDFIGAMVDLFRTAANGKIGYNFNLYNGICESIDEVCRIFCRSKVESRGTIDATVIDKQMKIGSEAILTIVANILSRCANDYAFARYTYNTRGGCDNAELCSVLMSKFSNTINKMFPVVYMNMCNIGYELLYLDLQSIPGQDRRYGPFGEYDKLEDHDVEQIFF